MAGRWPKRWTGWLIGAVLVMGVAAAGGPYVYIHFVEGKAPARLALPTTTTTAVGAAASTAPGPSSSGGGVDGTWKVATGSTAGYRIKETLFGQSNTAVGRTTAIAGTVNINGTAVTAGRFSVDMTSVSSDHGQRDGQFRGRIMNVSQFPTSTFTLTKPIDLGSVPADGATVTASATGDLLLHGTTKSVTFSIQAQKTGSTFSVTGSIPITFADYGINNPSGGPATTADNGLLEFLLNFTHG